MSRQQRRQQERSKKKYDKRQTFTKAEAEEMNEQAYKYGVAFALMAAKDVLSLGEVRLDRIRLRLKEYEFEYFQQLKPFDVNLDEVTEFKGAVNHARRKGPAGSGQGPI
jgi:hypothetical protein